MSWQTPAGARIDLEVLCVRESDGAPVDVYTMTYRLLDPTGAAVDGVSGDGEWEADGQYLVAPTMPSDATKGTLYLVEVTVTVTSGGATELLLIPVRVGGPTL